MQLLGNDNRRCIYTYLSLKGVSRFSHVQDGKLICVSMVTVLHFFCTLSHTYVARVCMALASFPLLLWGIVLSLPAYEVCSLLFSGPRHFSQGRMPWLYLKFTIPSCNLQTFLWIHLSKGLGSPSSSRLVYCFLFAGWSGEARWLSSVGMELFAGLKLRAHSQ
jgi:hypothetical protein